MYEVGASGVRESLLWKLMFSMVTVPLSYKRNIRYSSISMFSVSDSTSAFSLFNSEGFEFRAQCLNGNFAEYLITYHEP